MLASAPSRPWIWWRYIDDIFFIWTSDEESLTRFIDHMNSFHRTIKFTSEYSTTETHFLDVVIRKEENGLKTTDLFVKPTDKHQYLHSTSCHPRHCKTSIQPIARPSDYDEFALMTLTFCFIHRYSRRTLCPEVTVHRPFIKPSRKSSLCLGYPYFLRSPQPETVPIRRFLLLSPIIPLYPPYVRLPVLTTISSTPQIASNVLSLRSL